MSVFVEITAGNWTTVVGEIYRVPNSNVNQSIKRFNSIANKLKDSKKGIIIGTDQNFDLIKCDKDKNTKDLLDGLISTRLLPTIT